MTKGLNTWFDNFGTVSESAPASVGQAGGSRRRKRKGSRKSKRAGARRKKNSRKHSRKHY
jgi:hypothetical protein